MDRGTRRLLRDLDALGRVLVDRVPAWERLLQEVGPDTARKLVPGDSARTSSGRSAPGGRRVA